MAKRIFNLLLALALLAACLPVSAARAAGQEITGPGGEVDVTRVAGSNRFETAFQVADQMKQNLGVDKFEAVIVASGTNFADALGGSYLSAVKQAPILLSFNDKYNDLAKDYIRENLKPGGTVYILGGTNAVPTSMEKGLDGFLVNRLAGNDRFGTNLAILYEAGVADKDILVCTGLSFADSLSASASKLPILLVWKNLTDAQKVFLDNLNGNKFYVIGGETAVNKDMEKQVSEYGATKRIGGKNRFETSVLIAREFFDSPETTVLAYAWNYPDGLCGGGLATVLDAPLILTMDKYEAQAAAYVQEKGIAKGFVLGTGELISDQTVEKIFGTSIRSTFTVTFLNHDGTVLKEETVKKGESATAPTVPYRKGYTFTGWDGDFTNVKSDLILTAQYTDDAAPNAYTVTFKDYDGTVLKEETVTEGGSATAPADPVREGYTFTGWDKDFTNVTANLTVTAQYTENEKPVVTYTVTFQDYDGTVLKEETVAEGGSAAAPADPVREGYTFTGWDKDFTNVTANLTVTAQYTEDEKPAVTYTVTFQDYDGTVLKEETVTEGGSASAPEAPEREGYTFVGWSGSCSNVTGDLVLIAQYEENAHVHTPEVIPGVAATTTSTGLTEGSKCSSCGEILKEQEVIPMLKDDRYSITYNLSSDDAYLNEYLNTNPVENSNPGFYTSSDGLRLSDLGDVPGYIFEGWYDGAGANAERIGEIPKGSTGNRELYARWSLEAFTISFHNTGSEFPDATYTVNKVTSLTDPSRFGYVFTGWSTEEGDLVTEIPSGTTGDIALYANWSSERNRTVSEKLSDPIIYEDDENGTYLFVYKIGRIENVPLDVIHDFGYNTGEEGVKWEGTYQVNIDNAQAEAIVEVISNATVGNSAFTLSPEWSDTFAISESHSGEVSEEVIQANLQQFEATGKWNIGCSVGGARIHTTEDGYTNKVSAGGRINFGTQAAPVKGEISLPAGDTDAHNETETREANWNVEQGYKSGMMVCASWATTTAINQMVSDTFNIGQSVTQGDGESVSNVQSVFGEAFRKYPSSFAYSNSTTRIETAEYIGPQAAGYFRLVAAGTVHVFAAVGYDVANSNYFVYTFGVLDDEAPKLFLDYSATTSTYNDEENGALPFEVPYFVNEYIGSKLTATAGLTVDPDTGMITGFKGESTDIIIPEYMVVKSGIGTDETVRITGIAAGAFAGNTRITSVTLPDAVTRIPANAFYGCTALKEVTATSLTAIGDNAFRGCVSLEEVVLDKTVTALGKRAYEGVPKLTVTAANASVVRAAAASGAGDVTVKTDEMDDVLENMTLTVPAATGQFRFDGSGMTFKGVRIVSDAATTVISNAAFTGCTDIPLVLGSENVTLSRVSVESPVPALQLTAEDTAVALYGTVNLTTSGADAVLSNNLSLGKANASADGKLKVSGNVVICGTLEGEQLLSVVNGSILYSTGDSFTVYFDANGGTVEETSRLVTCGVALGELPVPELDSHTFLGWYDGQEEMAARITAETVWHDAQDKTVYAHWRLNDSTSWIPVF